ncbi:MAG: hypothetical protein U5M50_04110 [Sphingobium sp.]|nr:hypothetical protein [Sphingobium sp.]
MIAALTSPAARHVASILFFAIVALGSWTLIATTWNDNAAKIRRALGV